MAKKPARLAGQTLTAGLAKPAQRALANAGVTSLKQLAKKSEAEIAALHGMGPSGVAVLGRTLAANAMSFARSNKA